MPVITQTNTNETIDARTGVRTVEQVTVDVTTDVVTIDLHAKARTALAANATYLALATPTNAQNAAQIKALTRQHNAIIRLLIGADLLTDTINT